jgi:hypothetical protein
VSATGWDVFKISQNHAFYMDWHVDYFAFKNQWVGELTLRKEEQKKLVS